MQKNTESEYTIRRIPLYLKYLIQIQSEGRKNATASEMAEKLGIYPTQVRKDLSIAGLKGRPRLGHKIDKAINALEQYLGWNDTIEAVLVGAGRFGIAMMEHRQIIRTGIKVVGIFDSNPEKIGTKTGDLTILPYTELKDFIKTNKVTLGIITTPAVAAENIMNTMIESGIKSIWNLTAASLDAPEGINIETTNLYSSLAVLTRKHTH